MAVKVIRIYELDGIVNARLELVGGFFEVEVPAGPVAGGYLNKRLSIEQFTALLGGYVALSLSVAQGFAAASDVQPATFYGVTGNWNATGTDTTVYLHGVRPDAFHQLGVVYDAQAKAQLVKADVVAGTYQPLREQKLYQQLGDEEDGAPTNKLLKATAAGKADLVNGVVPASQLPSYVDDVLEFAQLSAFPTTGEAGKIYVALNTNKQYRWSGSGYALLSDSGLTADQQASFPAGASGTNKLVLSSVVGLLTALKTTDKTSVANAINELVARITFAGLGLQKNGNLLGLQQSVASVALPAFENIGLVSDTDGKIVADNDFAKGYRYAPYIALDPAGGPLTFSGGRSDFGAFYDKNFAFIRKINAVGYDANSYEPGIYYMRPSFPAAQYASQSYSLGRLPYVRAIRTSSGALLQPDQAGEIDGSALGGSATPGAGSIDYVNPLVHPDATALTSAAFGKLNQFTGTGQAAWNVALPDPAGWAGKVMYLQITANASGMWHFSGSGYAVSLWAKETLLLRCTGTGYERLSGNKVPLSAILTLDNFTPSQPGSDNNLDLPMGDLYDLSFPGVLKDNSGGLLLQAGHFVIPRKGDWVVTFSGKFRANKGEIVQIATRVNGNRYAANVSSGAATSGNNRGDTFPQYSPVPQAYEAGDTITLCYYADPGTNLGIYNGTEYPNFQPKFALTEQPS